MITLKDYQNRVLEDLRDFFRRTARYDDPKRAFQEITLRYTGVEMPYVPVQATGLAPGMPYVCLRVPTGGGKTLLACHAAGLALKDLLHAERGVVLWLVPSNTILEQTAEALRDPRHPYRRALELSCGAIEVVTIQEALRLSRATVEGQTVVIVATIQSFRVEDTTGRQVYAQNGTFVEHLQNVPAERRKDLLPGADGRPLPSLVNMLRLRRPVVIVDEAHNARTPLSFSTLGNVLPACVVEFTATPARTVNPSNVLHRVSAAELKAADMIKLPLRVVTRHPTQRDQLLAEAIALRADLERFAVKEAQKTGEYLRPIMLIQAERVDACEPLRERLVNDFNVKRDEIKISVGRLDELKDVKDISAQKCPVRFIITVEKLREGWDCPFAYILCSLKETRSTTAIEQIVGRVLRLPNARAKQDPNLDCAYVLTVSDSVAPVLAELRDALESNGFTNAEAERIILPVPQGVLPLGLQPQTARFTPGVEIDEEAAGAHATTLAGKVLVDAEAGEITVLVPLTDEETESLAACAKTPEARARIIETAATVREAEKAFGGTGETRTPTPYERRLDFAVPILCVRESGDLFEFEKTFLLEHRWKLSEKDAALSPDYDPRKRPAGQAGTIDLADSGKLETLVAAPSPESDFVSALHQQSLALGGASDWTVETLIAWLDRHIEHKDIPSQESAEFLRKVIRGLLAKYGIEDVGILALDRFRLRDQIEQRIEQHREAERTTAFRQYLLPDSPLAVSEERVIDFKNIRYEPSKNYEGSFRFSKHYFGPKPGELEERTQGGALAEEFLCAQYLEYMPEVEFWVRNLPRKTTSFRLQTSSDYFYPDFLCLLKDGRVLAVEYKGKQLYTAADAEEKRAVGAVWASRSDGKCLFVMPTGGDFSSIAEIVRR